MLQVRILNLTKNVRFFQIERFSTKKTIHRRKDASQKVKPALSPRFVESLKLWNTLLKDETKAASAQLSGMIKYNASWELIENRGLCVGNFTPIVYRHDPLNGKSITLHKRGLEVKKFIRTGAPVSISKLDDNNDIVHLGDGYITGVELEKLDILLSKGSVDKAIMSSESLLLMPSSSIGALENIHKLLDDPDSLSHNSVLLTNLAYRAAPMQSFHDRRLKSLPETLNESQVAAVSAAMNSKRNFLCIQGPPGTGKTKVIAECVFRMIQANKKVLICAPTHVAVKNAYDATIERMQDVYSEDDISQYVNSLNFKIVQDLFRKSANYGILVEISNTLKITPRGPLYKKLRAAMEKLIRETYAKIYAPRRAVFSTLSNSFIQKLPRYEWHADTIIVDEAAQCTEPSTWFPVFSSPACKKLILVGDPKQLPAVILSETGKKSGLGVSLMQRLADDFQKNNIGILLNEQHSNLYRMNKKIMQWSNEFFYESQLISHQNVENITLHDLYPNLPSDHVLNSPILMINTDDASGKTREVKTHTSYSNDGELKVMNQYINRLVGEFGVDPRDIGVITPYNGQNEELRQIINVVGVDVNTVDGFQGQEREIIIFCLVRDNAKGVIGFLQETRRLNVAVTRAKRQFLLVGSARMMTKCRELKHLYEYIASENSVYGTELVGSIDEDDRRDWKRNKK